ncbi:transposase [Rhizobium halophytocola]|uniref:Chromosomal replication initiator DnaA C-terminal domain-containing protein n=1 Tax=Rhizobium halophytocola TaxID=735519 RepID=A0ABS4E5R8_9HYPH|nr:transposase [Rhizobium halophytocola]MBP1853293.1 hypothetical protein [Rhizobium halophytocola]
MHHDPFQQIEPAYFAVISTRPFRVSFTASQRVCLVPFGPGAPQGPLSPGLRLDGEGRAASPDAPGACRIDGEAARKACRAIQRMAEELLTLEIHSTFVGKGRRAKTRTRHIAIYVAHVALGIGQQQLADAFGRDRSTVSYGCAVIEDRRDDPAFDGFIGLLERVVQAAFAPEAADHE